jgi:hypothetical protein
MTKPFPHSLKPGYLISGFKIRRSANAWWLDQDRVSKILLALSMDSNVIQALEFAGITARQYKYFLRLHPGFRSLISRYRLAFDEYARKAISDRDRQPGSLDFGALFPILNRTYVPPIRKFKSIEEWESQMGIPILLMDPERAEFNRILMKFPDRSGKKKTD